MLFKQTLLDTSTSPPRRRRLQRGFQSVQNLLIRATSDSVTKRNMKCFVFFFISLGLAMAFPRPQFRDAEEVGNQMTEPEQKEPGRRQMSFGSTAGNVGQQGTNSGNVAVGIQHNGKRQMVFGGGGYYLPYYGRRETETEEPERRQFNFGSTGGNVGQQGTNSGNVAVGHQWNGRK